MQKLNLFVNHSHVLARKRVHNILQNVTFFIIRYAISLISGGRRILSVSLERLRSTKQIYEADVAMNKFCYGVPFRSILHELH